MSVWGHAVHESRVVPVPGSDALAHRDSPCAGPRSLPSSAWSRVAFPYSRLPEKGTNLVTWGAAMIKKIELNHRLKKTRHESVSRVDNKPRLRAIQPGQLRHAAPSRSLG